MWETALFFGLEYDTVSVMKLQPGREDKTIKSQYHS